jgi:hypothetical protein
VEDTQLKDALAGRPRHELSDIFRIVRPWLKALSKDEAKVVSDILNCRTSVLGGHRLECDSCEHEEFSYNSCRNRHCPKCQFLAQARWVDARNNELLPVEYFHMVFTLPHELNPVVWANKKLAFDILFRAMSETIKEVGERRLKARVGFTAVLHTWSQTLNNHAHIHAIVPGGGLSLDGNKWISAKRGFFLPRKVLSRVFRGKYLSYLEQAYPNLKFQGAATSFASRRSFKGLLVEAARKDWVVYAKAPFAGPKQVLEYLGNYTHRIAISNYRIESVNDGCVTFRYKDRADENKTKLMRLPAQEFARRFLNHVLPAKFVRIRHFGFLGSRFKQQNIDTARKCLGAKLHVEVVKDEDYKQLLLRLVGHDVTKCPCCKAGRMVEVATLLPHPELLKTRRDTS